MDIFSVVYFGYCIRYKEQAFLHYFFADADRRKIYVNTVTDDAAPHIRMIVYRSYHPRFPSLQRGHSIKKMGRSRYSLVKSVDRLPIIRITMAGGDDDIMLKQQLDTFPVTLFRGQCHHFKNAFSSFQKEPDLVRSR